MKTEKNKAALDLNSIRWNKPKWKDPKVRKALSVKLHKAKRAKKGLKKLSPDSFA